MKKHGIISILLILAIAFSLCVPVSAAETASHITVHTYSDADEQHRLTTLAIYKNSVYIGAEDALTLSGYDTYTEEYGKIAFEYGQHLVEFRDGQINLGEQFYYPLQGIMDALSTAYHYDETSETLIFISRSSYFENLLEDCEEVFSGSYELDFLEGTGWQVAGVYEIVAGLDFVDLVVGNYETELYEDAITGILATDDSELTATLKQGNSIMSKLSTLLKFTQKDINDVETYADFLGTDLDGVIEAYSILNKILPGVSIGDAIEILDYVLSSTEAADVFPNAVKYGLVENPYILNRRLDYAAHRIYSLYDENRGTLDVVITNLVNDVVRGAATRLSEDAAEKIGENITLSIIEEFVGNEYGKIIINEAYVKLAKLVFDELGMKDRSTAVMQTVAARNIQYAAELQYALSNGETRYIVFDDYSLETESDLDPLRTKYSAILYLRACQYAYSLYEFDSNLAYWSDYWQKETAEAIDRITAYSDDELTQAVANEPLQIDNICSLDTVENSTYAFVPQNITIKDWSLDTLENRPNITFNADMTCNITFNMAEWVIDCSATYLMFNCADGRRVIKVDISGITIGDGKTHNTPYFYLFESEPGVWKYYGECVGITESGALYVTSNEMQIPVPVANALPEISEYVVGEYGWTEGEIFDSLTVESYENGEMTFDVEWLRTANIDNAVALAYGNIIPFFYTHYDATLNEYFYDTYGLIEVNEETIVLTIFSTQLPVEIGAYTYEKRTQENSTKPLPDGEYYAELYRDGTTLIAGCLFESVGILDFVEISNDEASHLEVGDVLELPGFSSILISALELSEGEEYKELWINDGEYRCCYIEETNTWRFVWPSDVAMTYCVGTYTVAAPAPSIIDMRTALGIGQNIYGDKYNGETNKGDLIFMVLSLSDYFSYTNSEIEYATITITDGIITEIFIPYRP